MYFRLVKTLIFYFEYLFLATKLLIYFLMINNLKVRLYINQKFTILHFDWFEFFFFYLNMAYQVLKVICENLLWNFFDSYGCIWHFSVFSDTSFYWSKFSVFGLITFFFWYLLFFYIQMNAMKVFNQKSLVV